ncbi:MAG TPA: PIN-like domain-containing protein, partial [Methylomirabilota bacterium]|nr:PIN-like domain-containing protein [Methylomirabilota bacterium]
IVKIKASITQAESKYPNLLQNDYLLERLTNLFNDRIGKEYSTKRLEEIYKEFEQRFRLQIPPGYKDKNPKKEGFKKYGDGVLWFQVIDYAKSQKKTIILITDDQKDDWWRIEKGETLGPRPELAAEIGSKAKVSFYMYNSSQFLKYAKEFLGLKVKQETIEEIKEVEINQRKYVGSSLARRGFQVENAVLEWIRQVNPDVQLIENPFDSGVDFTLTQPDGTKTGIEVKYKSFPFHPADVRRIIKFLTDRWIADYNTLQLLLVCENMEDAAQTLVKLREVTNIPPILTIKVGFMDGENSFRSFGTFLE